MTAELLSLSLQLSLPEVILAVGALALLMIGVFAGEKSAPVVTGLAVALLVVAALWVGFMSGTGEAWGGAFVLDPFARFMKVVALIGSIVAIGLSFGQARFLELDKFEYPVVLVLSTLGMMVLILSLIHI